MVKLPEVLVQLDVPPETRAKVPVELPMVLFEPAPVPNEWVPDAPVPMVELPDEVRVVNAPLEGVVAPMVVELMVPPVMVTPDEAKVLAVTPSEKENAALAPFVSKVTAPALETAVVK